MTQVEPLVGDFFVVEIGGVVGELIEVGEEIAGGGHKYQHAGLYVGNGKILQAQPPRSVLADVTSWNPDHMLWSTGKKSLELTDAQRAMVPILLPKFLGIPYGWLDYESLALDTLHVCAPSWLDRAEINVATWLGIPLDAHGEICSELVDGFRAALGSHLFTDNRAPGDVTPGQLGTLIEQAA